ncbi:hypothetical protein F511_06305 [Dorcoceras hygrometricum]|uniref:Uncharacterized protein n=1 Tax=Dorcoceras hygrometricum TaxID=472368 RepID=A0A2Z7AXS1_9LAMI|nr:hypothetical protein F511_06305 [Dorcoceras hygrometricum]
MSQRINRHHRRPSLGVFVLPENFSSTDLPEGIGGEDINKVMPRPSAAHAPANKTRGGMHRPPQPPASVSMTSDRPIKE